MPDKGNAGSLISANNTIRVLVVEPQKKPYQKEIPTGCEPLQQIIDGNFTVTVLADGVDIISADEYPDKPVLNRIVKGFPFYETFVVAGVNNKTGDTISLSPRQMEKYSKLFDAPVLAIPRETEAKTAHSHGELVEEALLSGSNVQDSVKRIYTFFRGNHDQKSRVKFLKKEYGMGGHYAPVKNGGHFDQSYDANGLTIDYQDDTLQFVDKLTWTQVSNGIDKLIRAEKYPVQGDWAEPDIEPPVIRENSILALPKDSEFEQLSLFDTQEYPSETERTAMNLKIVDASRTESPNKPTEIDPAQEELESGEPNHLGWEPPQGGAVSPAHFELEASPAVLPQRHNYRFSADFALPNGQKAKYKGNMEAIKLLKELEQVGTGATAEQQEVLAHYVGWGGIPQVFDENNPLWQKEYSALKHELDGDEYVSALASVNTAHFTSPVIIRGMYKALHGFGFRGGNLFDPALGIGHFYGALPGSMRSSKLYSTELDSITGRIAKQLYPSADIQIAGFETVEYPENLMDVGVGNVPFGDYSLFDPKYNKAHLNVHEYFFAKSLDVLRPNGILAFITSKWTLDKANPTFRKYLAQRAELLGAIRLPNTAFKQNANTDVTSDIIFLKKREYLTTEEPDWIYLGQTEDGIPLNLYYLQNPQMMLGKMVCDSMYGDKGRETALIRDERDLETALNEAVSFLPTGVYEGVAHQAREEKPDVLPASPYVKNFAYAILTGEVYYRENSIMTRQELPNSTEQLVSNFCDLKSCVRNVLNIQKDGCGDSELVEAQSELNRLYDGFVAKHGFITKKANYKLLQKDIEYFLVSSLEDVNADTGAVTKRDIFTKRTITPNRIISNVNCAKDALSVSLSEKGLIDFTYMQSIYNMPLPEIIDELGALIYLNPDKYNPENAVAGYETESEYLSGNVREKLQTAQRAAAEYPELFGRNAEALERVQPEDIPAEEIEIHIGSNFIPLEYYNQFIYETLKPGLGYRGNHASHHIFVRYNQFNNSYFITNKSFEAMSVLAKDTFGTERMSAYHIIESCLNLQSATVKVNVAGAGEPPCYVLNPTETTVAKQKQELLQAHFKEWLFSDATRRSSIVRGYNDKFNTTRLREYDGSLLANIAGLNPAWKLRHKQADAVARGIFSGRNALFAHCVGAGKTLVCAAVVMERKRLGLSSKAMIVVPNALTDQWKNLFLDYFPSANLLVATKADFEKSNRRTFISKIATGNYDAVILGFSQFERIPVSDTLMTRELKGQLAYITGCVKQLRQEGGEKWTVKQAEEEKKKLEAQLKTLMNNAKKDDVINFEELGVDSLVVDEAHNYKNCALFTKLRNVAGIGNRGAKKSTDLLLKCKYLAEQNNYQGGIYFATGTPLSNSIAEMFTIQRYLMNDELQKVGFDYFDNWVSVFGETVTSMELKPEGNGYRPRTRLSRFVNLPELMTSFRTVADIQTADMLNLPKPKLSGGKAQIAVAPPSPALLKFLMLAAARADRIRNNDVNSTVDNMLKLTGDARRAGTDMRLLDPSLPDVPYSKLNLCVRNVLDIYHKTSAVHGVQLVFCDISTPNPQKFNVYDDIRAKWIAAGIPAREIAFIHNANNEIQLAKLFSQLRMGQVRILIGSSAKCGAGMNVQDRLTALHHLDAPWTPKDIEQREGRILRPGNCNEEVSIFRYVTKKSFDSYMWSILENKQRFISQVMTSKSLTRVCEDIDETVLSYAEIKAIANGNPKIKEKMEVDIELLKLKTLKSEYSKKRFRLQDEFQVHYPRTIADNKKQAELFQSDKALRDANTTKDFAIQLNGRVYTEKEQAGALIIKTSGELATPKLLQPAAYRGFQLEMVQNFGTVYVRLCGARNYRVELSSDGTGMIQRMDNALNAIEKRIAKLETENVQNENYIAQAQQEYAKPFEKEESLQQLLEKQVELEKELQLNQKPIDEQPWQEGDVLEEPEDCEMEEEYEMGD